MFLETGLLACVVVVIVAQLMPQIVASLYPVQFLELVVMRPAYYACIGLELCGFTHFCWVLAAGMARLFRMKKEAGAVVVQVTRISIISMISIIYIISKYLYYLPTVATIQASTSHVYLYYL